MRFLEALTPCTDPDGPLEPSSNVTLWIVLGLIGGLLVIFTLRSLCRGCKTDGGGAGSAAAAAASPSGSTSPASTPPRSSMARPPIRVCAACGSIGQMHTIHICPTCGFLA